jgi:methyltransferase family protein
MGLTELVARKVTNYQDPNALASRIRRRRLEPLVRLIKGCRARHGSVRILDVGGTEEYWRLLPEPILDSNVQVTLLNLPGEPRPSNDSRFRFVEADACDLPQYGDGAFDIVHSNSVIEHVGDWPRMVSFAGEVRRLAPNYFVQTPYFWFPIEPHWMAPLFHWLPRPVRVGLVMRLSLGHQARCETVGEAVLQVDSARLLDKRMFRYLFPDAELMVERILGVPKSLLALRENQA